MKFKLLALLTFSIAIFRLNSMESQLNLDRSPALQTLWQTLTEKVKTQILSYTVWYSLPEELKIYIVSYISQADSLKKVIKKLGNISRTNKEFNKIAQIIIEQFAEKYVTEQPKLAIAEFFSGVKRNRISLVDALLKAKPDLKDLKSENGHSALTYAAKFGYKDIIKLLLNLDVQVDLQCGYQGDTPLIHASRLGSQEIVQLLLNAGADINFSNKIGVTPLITAVKGNKDIVELLISSGANVNISCKIGTTPLMEAVSYGDKEIVELLIEAGANVDAKDNLDRTALAYAAEKGDKEIFKLLFDLSAGISSKDKSGWSPVTYAASTGNKDIVKTLIEAGADDNVKEFLGLTALSCTMKRKHAETVNGLSTKSKCKIERPTKRKKTE